MTPLSSIDRETFQRLCQLAVDLHDEAVKCAEAGAYRAGVVMIGAALEAILLVTATSYEKELREAGNWRTDKHPLRWDLNDLIGIAKRAGWLVESGDPASPDLGDVVPGVQWLRNLVHPGKLVREVGADEKLDEAVFQAAYSVLNGAFDVSAALFDELPSEAPQQ